MRVNKKRISPLMKKYKPKKIAYVGMVIIFLIGICAIGGAAATSAYDNATIITLLNRYNFPKNNFVAWICRWIGWLLINGLRTISNQIEGVVDDLLGVAGTFYKNEEVTKFVNGSLLPIAFIVFAVFLAFIGILYMAKPQQGGEMLKNLAISLVVLVGLPFMITSFYDITSTAITALEQDEAQKYADTILLDNVTDILQYDLYGFVDLTSNSHYASSKDADGLSNIDIVEFIKPETANHPEIWGNAVVTDASGGQTLKKFDNGLMKSWAKPLTDTYYRWQVNWLNLFISLLLTCAVLCVLTIRVAKLVFDVALHQAIAQVVAVFSVHSTERLKKVIQSLMSLFFSLFGTFALLKFYLIGLQFVNGVEGAVVSLVLMVGLGLLAFSAMNIIEQLFGSSMSEGKGSVSSFLFGANSAVGLLKSAKSGLVGSKSADGTRQGGLISKLSKGAGKAGGLAGAAGGLATGAVAGKVSAHKDRHDSANGTPKGMGQDKQSNGQGKDAMAKGSSSQVQEEHKRKAPLGIENKEQPQDKLQKPRSGIDSKRDTHSSWQEQAGLAPELQDDWQTQSGLASELQDKQTDKGRESTDSDYTGETLGSAAQQSIKSTVYKGTQALNKTAPVAMTRRAFSLSYNSAKKGSQRRFDKRQGE